MQMCPKCYNVYDEQNHSSCPSCTDESDVESGEKYYKICPNCGGIMYWDEIWECGECGKEIDSSEFENDGIVEN